MNPLLLAAALGALTSPIQAEHERSREARDHVAARETEPALQAYQALEGEVGPRPEIEIGRGAALLPAGRLDEAAQAFARARQAPEPLGSRALLGLGAALAARGESEGAIAAYREALQRDPDYAEARQDLEVLLRRKQEEQQQRQQQQGGGSQDGKRADRKPDPSQDPGRQQKPEQGREPKAGEQEQQATAPRREQQPGERRPGPQAAEKPSRDEALRLLDAMRAREQNLPETARRRTSRRGDAEKDW